jgi:hypothetical protein
MPKNATRDALVSQASCPAGTEEKEEIRNMKERLAFCWASIAPIPGRFMSFVMKLVPYVHPTSADLHFHKRHLDKKLHLARFSRYADTVISAVNSDANATSYLSVTYVKGLPADATRRCITQWC